MGSEAHIHVKALKRWSIDRLFNLTCGTSNKKNNKSGCKICIKNYTHIHLTALFPSLPGWAGTRQVKPIWNLLKQETVSGSGISWAICKSAPRSGQIITPSPQHSIFYRLYALPATQPTVSKHWRQLILYFILKITKNILMRQLTRKAMKYRLPRSG